jgi:phospholipid-translocating ATPase
MVHKRNVFFNKKDSKSQNFTPFPNIIKNQKYNIITLIPVVLIIQFSMFSNQFYLLLAASQFFDALKVGFLFSYVAPLVLVLSVTIIKEALDDYCRYKRDKEANNQKFIKITSTGRKEIRAADMQIGDIIELNQNERAPADLIILKSYEEGPGIFIRTDQLDGETDWKLRKPPHSTQKFETVQEILSADCYLYIDPPGRNIYEFNGVLILNEEGRIYKDPLGLENTMWSNTVLASKKVIGCVIYTGKETRTQMNSSLPRSKIGLLDLEINKLSKILFFIMLICSLIILILKGISANPTQNLITFFRFIVLLCSIIPISLRTNLDISKTLNSSQINDNPIIEGTIVRNSTIPEELGRIEFVFSDKTGTLTKNEMIFKKLSLEADQFSDENVNDIQLILQHECGQSDYPMSDLVNLINRGEYNFENVKRIRRNRTKVTRDAVTAIALCNNVTPIIDREYNTVNYQASSPDEIALVIYAEKLNMRLIYRTDSMVKLLNANGVEEHYQILANFPFSSETKRMGIIVRNLKNGKIYYYLKGAENVIETYVKEDYKSYIRENSEILASSGLRTLVITQKILDENFFQEWYKNYQNSLTSMIARKEKIQHAISLLETNMEFLCVTGVEDQLQDEVSDTIECLRNAGIKIWMLTGDKIETATCIAISTGLKSKNQRITCIKESNNPLYVKEELEKFRYQHDQVLIIDGNCLEIALTHCEKTFFEASMNAASVVCCRCSPTQKARIVRNIKKYTSKITCSIGDGGNDVSMIQEAHVGVGLEGKEGKQASLAADYSINKFKHLHLLLLWFGRLSYKNTATISKFVIHRGLIISFLQFIFSIMFYCSSIPLYNGTLILGYTSAFTAFPVISLLFDRDTDVKNVVKFPSLYKSLQKGRELSVKAFLWWFWKSLFQASIIMIGCIMFFENVYLKIATVTFTTLIFAELLNVYTEVKQ